MKESNTTLIQFVEANYLYRCTSCQISKLMYYIIWRINVVDKSTRNCRSESCSCFGEEARDLASPKRGAKKNTSDSVFGKMSKLSSATCKDKTLLNYQSGRSKRQKEEQTTHVLDDKSTNAMSYKYDRPVGIWASEAIQAPHEIFTASLETCLGDIEKGGPCRVAVINHNSRFRYNAMQHV